MPNWFESNPTKSVVSYTIVVAAATWAMFTFVLQDNRINLVRSELETQKSLTEQYRSKVELLQRDLDATRNENAEYRHWLGKIDHAIPVIVPRITELKEKIASLESSRAAALKSVPNNSILRARKETATRGTAYVDDLTGAVVAVLSVSVFRTAQISLKLPDKDAPIIADASPGSQWTFTHQDQKLVLTILSISYVGDYVDFQIDTAR